MPNWILNFKNYQKFVSDSLIEFEEGKEWDVDEWNLSYIFLKEWMDRVSSAYLRSKHIQDLVTDFVQEFYQDASPATHSYWLKSGHSIDQARREDIKRTGSRPGLGTAIQDQQYHGKWINE